MRTSVKTFHFAGTLFEENFQPGEIKFFGLSLLGEARAMDDRPLVGLTPKIRFFDDQVVLIAPPGTVSAIRFCAFPAGDLVERAARPGDRIEVERTWNDGVCVRLYRADRLLAAVGAICGRKLEPDFQVLCPGREDAR